MATRLDSASNVAIAALSVLIASSRLSLVACGVSFENSDHRGPCKDRIDSARFLGVLLKVVEWIAFLHPMGEFAKSLPREESEGV